jgi:hypothetical protein
MKFVSMRLYFLLAASSTMLKAETAAADESIPSSVLHYEFTRANCLDQTFPNLNSLPLNLTRNENTTSCSPSLGVESSVLATRDNPSPYLKTDGVTIESLLDHFHSVSNGISVELWFHPHDDPSDSTLHPILTFGSALETDSPANLGLTECDSQLMDLQLGQRGNFLELIYRTNDPYFEPCQRFRLVDMPLRHGKLNHVVVTLGDRHQQIFLNGQASIKLEEPFDNSLRNWNPHDYLQLFSYLNNAAWHGRLYQMSVYDSVLNGSQVITKLSLGLPPSQPYAISNTVRLYEDAELLPGSHKPEWYFEPTTFVRGEIPEIELTPVSPDREIHALLQSLNVTHDSPKPVFVYITKLPLRGDLYQVDGSKITSDSGAAILILEEAIVFLPFQNEHSSLPGATYASFDFCVTDHEIFVRTQCESETLSIVVDAVNDPATPIARPEIAVVQEGILPNDTQVIELSGIDVDEGDFVDIIMITHPPKKGHLVLSVSTFRNDGLLHETLLSDIDYTVPGKIAYVEYRYHGSDQVVQGTTVTDSFRFRVSDRAGTWSAEKVVTLQVVSAMQALTSPVVSILEDSTGDIRLHGVDHSDLYRKLGYFIESVPSETEGETFDSLNVSLKAGTMLEVHEQFPYRDGLNITFQPSPDYCTSHSSPDTNFSYRVAALVGDRVTSISSVVVQHLLVQCANDPLTFTGPNRTYYVEAFEGFQDDPCSGYVYNASEVEPEACPAAAIVSGFEVTSRDRHSAQALVSITADHGLLTLNRNHWNDLIPLMGREEVRSSIMFLALPDKLDDILSYLHFQSDVPGDDTIRIVVRYGNCNATVLPVQMSYAGGDCQVITHSIPVVVMERAARRSDALLFGNFQWMPLPFTFALLLLIKLKGKVREALSNKHRDESINQISTATTVFDDSDTLSCSWIQFYDDESGYFYYQNAHDGTVTWEPPLGEDFIRAFEE